MSDIEFIDGLSVKAPHANAPDYVKAKLSIKRLDLIAWLQARDGDWINADVKVSQGGKWYCAVDDWKPDGNRSNAANKPAPEQALAMKSPVRGSVSSGPREPAGIFPDDDIPY